MERELALGIVRVTEVAAVNCARWMGRGKKMEADEAATSAMRRLLDTLPMEGTVVIGEGEMDEAPMLYIGERLGTRVPPMVDIAVDPLEGTNVLARGAGNALCVVAVGLSGALLHAPDMYMDKIAVGPICRGQVDIRNSVAENLHAVAQATSKDISEVVVAILDRPRHRKIVEDIRQMGARIKLIPDGDIVAALSTAFEHTGVDLLLGTGGSPEGVLSAAALKCLGGELQGRLMPDTEEQEKRCRDMGLIEPTKILYMEDLVPGDDVLFAATGVTDGELLRGVQYRPYHRVHTHSVLMSAKTGTVRFIEAIHNVSKDPLVHEDV